MRAVVAGLGVVAMASASTLVRAQPGQVEVDPAAAERALERTLTAEGALLLPRGRFEIEPSFAYLRRESDLLAFRRDANGRVMDFGLLSVERDEMTVQADARLGLPLNMQLEVGVPYEFISSSTTGEMVGGRIAEDDEGSGFGDVSVGIAGTLLRESGWRPDIIARLNWDTATGATRDDDFLLDTRFNEIRGSFTFLKRQDPLAFVGSVFYGTGFEKDNINPGDEYGFALQTVMATSPHTSLRLGFSQSFSNDVEIDGITINNSGQTQGLLQLGASTTLGRGLLLDVSLNAGLTDDAPAYFLRVGIPFQPNISLF